ncbi:PGF-CTERM sorting domain-containing protein [Halorussus salilacus]|uniref:DUF7490 domain-containing protein n=1 Tax=Halorussus salilacus TaxID=2953750 RepID=UPI00209E87E7|nr:PGF-CTERM sorting domain-containing protein [Halorussus salilacus]USZ67545.1 PGF-CTERM sorting domain-containing protein [Halorussus salilacus]
MNRETMLALGIAVVVAVSLVSVAAVPDAFADPDSDPVRPGHVSIEEVSIAPGAVSGGTANLTVDSRLGHRGGTTENVSVLVRAVGLESGLEETAVRAEVGEISGDREVSVVRNLSVERAGGYRIETVVYRDDERIADGSKEVRGVGTLVPEYARTSVDFHWRADDDLPAVEYTVADAGDNRTALNVSTYLTNEGDDPSEELRVVLTARQADSNIVADRATVPVGTIEPGRTATPNAELAVPDGYNYYLDAVLWKDGVVVGTARSVANLDPTETIEADETVREVGIEVGDFEDDDAGAAGAARETEEPAADAGEGGTPGFTAAGALTALVAALLLARRQS